jgi:lipoate-protein ligase A
MAAMPGIASPTRIFGTTDWRRTRALLLYRNEPAIVIGRHQNPWLEVSIPRASTDGVPILRRRSGGGTVYHVRATCGLVDHGTSAPN